MNVFGIGAGELLVILLIAVLVFGPDKLPEAARKAGKWYAEFRRLTQDVTSQVTRQLDEEIREDERARAARPADGASPAPSVIEGEATPGEPSPPASAPPDDTSNPRADP
jgi:Tat protein translocase TatB subunit